MKKLKGGTRGLAPRIQPNSALGFQAFHTVFGLFDVWSMSSYYIWPHVSPLMSSPSDLALSLTKIQETHHNNPVTTPPLMIPDSLNVWYSMLSESVISDLIITDQTAVCIRTGFIINQLQSDIYISRLGLKETLHKVSFTVWMRQKRVEQVNFSLPKFTWGEEENSQHCWNPVTREGYKILVENFRTKKLDLDQHWT